MPRHFGDRGWGRDSTLKSELMSHRKTFHNEYLMGVRPVSGYVLVRYFSKNIWHPEIPSVFYLHTYVNWQTGSSLPGDGNNECPVFVNNINIGKPGLPKPAELGRQFLIPVKGSSSPENL
jgi:hypothetical protein